MVMLTMLSTFKRQNKGLEQLGWQSTLVIVLVGLLVRFGCSWADVKLWPDSGAYITSAQALLSGDLSTFYPERTPGIPLLIAGLMRLLNVQPVTISGEAEPWMSWFVVLQSGFGILSGLLVAWTVTTLFSNRRWGFIAGLMAVLLPDIILYEHSILSESLYAVAMALLAFGIARCRLAMPEANAHDEHASTRQQWLIAIVRGSLLGALLTLCIWTRAIAIPVALVLGVVLLFQKRWRVLVVMASWLVLTVGTWVVFHQQVHGVTTYAASGGLNQLYKVIDFVELPPKSDAATQGFYQQLIKARGKFPYFRTYEAVNDAHLLSYWAEKEKRPYWQSYLEHDALARQLANYSMQQHPIAYVQRTIGEFSKLLVANTPWDKENVIWWPLLIVGGTGFMVRAAEQYQQSGRSFQALLSSPALWLLLILAVHLTVYPLVTVSDSRYRIPLEVLLLIGIPAWFIWPTFGKSMEQVNGI